MKTQKRCNYLFRTPDFENSYFLQVFLRFSGGFSAISAAKLAIFETQRFWKRNDFENDCDFLFWTLSFGLFPMEGCLGVLSTYFLKPLGGTIGDRTRAPFGGSQKDLEEGKRPTPPRQDSASGLYKPPAALLQDPSLCILPLKMSVVRPFSVLSKDEIGP